MTVCLSPWKKLSGNTLLSPDEVHVWKVRLDIADPDRAVLAGCLDGDEQARAARFRFDVDRNRYMVVHAVMRRILSQYVRCSPFELYFRTNGYGKPHLVGVDEPLQFNLTHSDDLALVAVTRSMPVGIDIERHDLRKFDLSVARQFFSRWEYEVLIRAPHLEQKATFFRHWARKEAFVKGCGYGFSFPTDQFEVRENKLRNGSLLAVRGKDRLVKGWSLRDLEVGPGYSAAVAVKAPQWHLYCFEWSSNAHD